MLSLVVREFAFVQAFVQNFVLGLMLMARVATMRSEQSHPSPGLPSAVEYCLGDGEAQHRSPLGMRYLPLL